MNTWTALFLVLSVVAVASPFFMDRDRRTSGPQGPPAGLEDEAVAQVIWAMEELEVDAAAGKISEEDRQKLGDELEQKLARLRRTAAERTGSGDGGLSRG